MIKVSTLVLALLVTLVSHGAAQEKAKSEIKPSVQTRLSRCNIFLDGNVRRDIKETGHSNNQKYIKYVKCVYLALGYVNQDGDINCELLKKGTIHHARSVTKGTAIYEKCIKQTASSENFPHSYDKCFQQSMGRLKKVPAEKCEEDDDQKE